VHIQSTPILSHYRQLIIPPHSLLGIVHSKRCYIPHTGIGTTFLSLSLSYNIHLWLHTHSNAGETATRMYIHTWCHTGANIEFRQQTPVPSLQWRRNLTLLAGTRMGTNNNWQLCILSHTYSYTHSSNFTVGNSMLTHTLTLQSPKTYNYSGSQNM
jgi:hypothetical protein